MILHKKNAESSPFTPTSISSKHLPPHEHLIQIFTTRSNTKGMKHHLKELSQEEYKRIVHRTHVFTTLVSSILEIEEWNPLMYPILSLISESVTCEKEHISFLLAENYPYYDECLACPAFIHIPDLDRNQCEEVMSSMIRQEIITNSEHFTIHHENLVNSLCNGGIIKQQEQTSPPGKDQLYLTKKGIQYLSTMRFLFGDTEVWSIHELAEDKEECDDHQSSYITKTALLPELIMHDLINKDGEYSLSRTNSGTQKIEWWRVVSDHNIVTISRKEEQRS